MYETFYGLTERPFSLLPDPSFLYLGQQHGTAYSLLEYALLSQAGFAVVTGEVGCGKTTLIRHLLCSIGDTVTVGLITNTANARDNLLKWVLLAFRQEYKGKDQVELHESFEDFLIAEYQRGQRTVLIVDEAQNLPIEVLEELRLLSNINADKDQILQLILVGQPELRLKLERPDLQQFAQRVVVGYHLTPLSEAETPRYIQHRLVQAGGAPDLFTTDAVALIHQHSGGVPRLINTLCDLALVYGYAENAVAIDEPLVQAVIDDRAGAVPSQSRRDRQPSEADYPSVAVLERNTTGELLRKK